MWLSSPSFTASGVGASREGELSVKSIKHTRFSGLGLSCVKSTILESERSGESVITMVLVSESPWQFFSVFAGMVGVLSTGESWGRGSVGRGFNGGAVTGAVGRGFNGGAVTGAVGRGFNGGAVTGAVGRGFNGGAVTGAVGRGFNGGAVTGAVGRGFNGGAVTGAVGRGFNGGAVTGAVGRGFNGGAVTGAVGRGSTEVR